MKKSRIGIGGCVADDHIMEYAWENGVRLFDTGWGYQGNLVFENMLGNFIEKHKDQRSEMIIVDKFPTYDKMYIDEFGKPLYSMTDEELEKAIYKVIRIQLETLKTEYIDYYLIHALYDDQHNIVPKFDINVYKRILNVLVKLREEGLVKHLGFSAHITFEKLYYFVNETKEYKLDIAEVSYNVLNNNGHDINSPKGFNHLHGVMVWSAVGEKGIQFLKDNGFTILDCMPHEGGRLNQLSTSPEWIRWNDSFILANKNIDYVLEGTTSEEHLDSLLVLAGEKKDPHPVPDMRKLTMVGMKGCHGE